jgi:hypothetical protein
MCVALGAPLRAQTAADGSWRATGDVYKDSKASMWKSSYHSSRSVLFLEQWMRRAANAAAAS